MSSSSSDEDCDVTQLREAVATEFLSEDLYREGQGKPDATAKSIKLTSLRPQQDDEECHFNELGVTLEFRLHVAKQLVSLLDKSLRKSVGDVQIKSKTKKKGWRGGVKLFTGSDVYVQCSSNKHIQPMSKTDQSKRPYESDNDSEDDRKKLRSVIVETEHVLSKKETLHWSKRSKAEIFTYKTKEDGQLYLTNQINKKKLY